MRGSPTYRSSYSVRSSSPQAPNEGSNYSSEARQAPTSNDTVYVFPWNSTQSCFSIPPNFDKLQSEGRVNEQMLNALFRDLHSIILRSPLWYDPLPLFATINFTSGVLMFFGYLFWGLFTNYHSYQIKTDLVKRYIEDKPVTARFIEIPLVGVAAMLLGVFSGFVLLNKAAYRESYRLKRRAFVVKKIVEKHQNTTFAGSGCTVSCSPLAAYITIKFDFKQPPPPTQVIIPPVVATRPSLLPRQSGLVLEPRSLAVVLQPMGIRFEKSQLGKKQIPPEKTEVPNVPPVKDHPEDVSIRIPEEQPL